MKRTKQIAGIVIVVALFWGAQINVAFSQAEISVRAVGDIKVDTLNNLDGMVQRTDTFQLVISAKTTAPKNGATLGFIIYSPDNSFVSATDVSMAMTPFWASLWTQTGSILNNTDRVDGVLPEQYLTGGVTLPGDEFQSNSFVDILTVDITYPQPGIICIDSAFFPPAGEWLMIGNDNSPAPAWLGGKGDATVGGSRPGAFCITVGPGGCCYTAGDADHNGMVNIADVTSMLARIFGGAPPPVCVNEADANGHGGFNITDVTFMIAWIFRGGFPPTCPANSN